MVLTQGKLTERSCKWGQNVVFIESDQMGITKIRWCVLGPCLSWKKEARANPMWDLPLLPIKPPTGWKRHIQTYGSVDKRHVPRADGTFMSMDVSAYTALRGNLYSERIDNHTLTAMPYKEQCIFIPATGKSQPHEKSSLQICIYSWPRHGCEQGGHIIWQFVIRKILFWYHTMKATPRFSFLDSIILTHNYYLINQYYKLIRLLTSINSRVIVKLMLLLLKS